VFRVACKDNAAGELFERRGAIERVGNEVFARGEDVFCADDLLERGNYFWRERHVWRGCFNHERWSTVSSGAKKHGFEE